MNKVLRIIGAIIIIPLTLIIGSILVLIGIIEAIIETRKVIQKVGKKKMVWKEK